MARQSYHPQPICFRVSPWAKERLVEKAAEQAVDVSDVVRAAVDEYLSRQGAGVVENNGMIPADREPRSSFVVVLTPEWLKETEHAVRRMGMTLGQAMREGALHLVREHMPELCSLCGGSKDERLTYCKPWGHDIQCMHRFHFDDTEAWMEATGAEPASFPELSDVELAVVGTPDDYAWEEKIDVLP